MLKNLIMSLLRAPLRALRARRERRALPGLQAALAHYEAGQFVEAAAEGRKAAAKNPRSAQANLLCAKTLLALEQQNEAFPYLQAAVLADPDLADAHALLAAGQAEAGDASGAETSYRRALALCPDATQYRLGLVELLEAGGRKDDALHELSLAQEFAPERPDLLLRLFNALSRLGMFSQALQIAERSIHESGANFDTLYLLAAGRYGVADMTGAVDACRRAMALRADRPEIHVTLGSALFALGDVDAAGAAYQRALELAPGFPDAEFHIGLLNLMQGRYREGWKGFGQRFRRSKTGARRSAIPAWDGGSLKGRDLYVMREQGLGDEIMFASCYPQIISDARRCFIECESRLERLFARSFPGATFLALENMRTDDGVNAGRSADVSVYAGSLPQYLRQSAVDFPAHQGYLRADPQRVEFWRKRLAALGAGLKVGLSWRGGTAFTHQQRRTLALETLSPLLSVPGVHWVNLQYGQRSHDLAALKAGRGIDVVDWPDAIDGDYDETAALVTALDLVISVCTSVVHLAGALGKPAWVMTAHVPEWRYGLGTASMPWYPAVQLFRQPEQGNWVPVIAEIERALRRRVAC